MSDTDRFRRLFDEHRTTVFRFAPRRVGPDMAEDVLAETFLVAWRRLQDMPPVPNGPGCWRRRDWCWPMSPGHHADGTAC